MSEDVLVSVIVPVWNDEKRIFACIDALKQQSIGSAFTEIIVVDNNSTDSTYQKLLGVEGIVLLQESQPGSYAARNTGLNRASGKYVAFTDSDCVPNNNWLSELITNYKDYKNVGVVAGNVRFFKDEYSNAEESALLYESIFSMDQESYASQGLCITANWLSERSLLLEQGGFDTRLKSGGDHEMSKRLSRQGYLVVYASSAVVEHPARNKSEILKKRRRVIGGAWDKSSGVLKYLKLPYYAIKLFVKRSLLIALEKNITFSEKIKIWSILFVIFLFLYLRL